MCCFVILAAAITLHIDTTRPVNAFDPREALGAGVDGHERGQVKKMLRTSNVQAMLSAGLQPLAYRLRTELAGEAWHWNPKGRWSDPAHQQGYWISDSTPAREIRVSYGYRMPRRGNTTDQANDDGYSRLDDGNTNTFWKSNPYLDRHFTAEDNAAHPAWVVIDFGAPVEVDTLRVLWGEPHATRLTVESSTGDDIDPADTGIWKQCAGPGIESSGGDQSIRLAPAPVTTRYLRLVMTAFSGSAPPGSVDLRDRLGVAIREIYAMRDGADVVRHSPDHAQTQMYVSSTDPWHRAVDLDPKIEQPGFDLVYRSGLTRGLPMLLALPLLYDVPENAAAAVAYLKRRNYSAEYAELGEEPEEQYVMPEDYGALYVQWVRALGQVSLTLKIGGTSMVLPVDDGSEPSWVHRLFSWFRAQSLRPRPAFFSFEWYPFDDVCEPAAPQLLEAPRLLAHTVEQLHRDGLGPDTPMFITEYGYSAYSAEAEVDLPGALLNADIVGQFLTLGGARTYLYGYEPNELINEKQCSWGNNMLFGLGEHGGIEYRTAPYWAARLLSQEWVDPSGGRHEVLRVNSDSASVTAYAVRRPDRQVALLVIHKDPDQPAGIVIPQFEGALQVVQYSRIQYQWKADGDNGHPERNLPPEHRTTQAGAILELPPYSITVIRGRLH